MYYVYLLQSINFPDQTYIGYTKNLDKRLEAHNQGNSLHTAKYKPWKVVMHLVFQEEKKAITFEKYLKTYSGKAFAKKRLL
jgi:predicted GIY-YIG superfamily endonuclease